MTSQNGPALYIQIYVHNETCTTYIASFIAICNKLMHCSFSRYRSKWKALGDQKIVKHSNSIIEVNSIHIQYNYASIYLKIITANGNHYKWKWYYKEQEYEYRNHSVYKMLSSKFIACNTAIIIINLQIQCKLWNYH